MSESRAKHARKDEREEAKSEDEHLLPERAPGRHQPMSLSVFPAGRVNRDLQIVVDEGHSAPERGVEWRREKSEKNQTDEVELREMTL